MSASSEAGQRRDSASPQEKDDLDLSASENANDPDESELEVDEDDCCPVCQLLLYRPVTTTCRHTLCQRCFEYWADISAHAQMVIVPIDDESQDPSTVEAKCPMCRTPTTAALDQNREDALRQKYPGLYRQRGEEVPVAEEGAVEFLTLRIGNKHQLVPDPRRSLTNERAMNKHDWTFFVKPSRTDIIDRVHIMLHPTFSPSRIILDTPPYEVHRLGWGYFTITARIILTRGWSWVSDDAEAISYGSDKGMLPIDWTLDFTGRGSQGRCRLKVRRDPSFRPVTTLPRRSVVRMQ